MPMLTIQRMSGTALFRSFSIYINGQKVGKINEGEVKQIDIPNGEINIQVALDMWKSIPLKASADDGNLGIRIFSNANAQPKSLADSFLGALRWFRKKNMNSYLYLEKVSTEEILSSGISETRILDNSPSTIVHGILDMLTAFSLFFVPSLIQLNKVLDIIFPALAAIQFIIIFFTNYPVGQFKIASFSLHQKTERTNAILLIALALVTHPNIAELFALLSYAVVYFILGYFPSKNISK